MSDSPYVLEKYADRLRADLEANEKEQQRLRDLLHQLEREHEVLVKMQATLDTGAEAVERLMQERPAAGETSAPDGDGPVPRTKSARAGRRRPKSGGQRRGRRPGERPLIDIVGTLLREQEEPRSVSEIRQAVMKTRPATEQTVRNTLDRLVATSKAERTKQGRSVFYSATESPTPVAAGSKG